LPSDRPRGYDELAEWVLKRLPGEDVALIAESFSGPLALMVADRSPSVIAVVLCATFVLPPLSWPFTQIPKLVWDRPPPAALLSLMLTGGDRSLALAVQRALVGLRGEVVAERVAAALRVDVTAELGRYSRPLLYLRAGQDRVIRTRSSRRIQALKPSMRVVEVAGPHLLLQRSPSEAWTHIKPFLEQARRAARPRARPGQ
jgi:pimeloyl-ACP methyl ester carboxylesterase